MDIHTLDKGYEHSNKSTNVVKTTFYTERVKNPTKIQSIRLKIGQWIKKMLP